MDMGRGKQWSREQLLLLGNALDRGAKPTSVAREHAGRAQTKIVQKVLAQLAPDHPKIGSAQAVVRLYEATGIVRDRSVVLRTMQAFSKPVKPVKAQSLTEKHAAVRMKCCKMVQNRVMKGRGTRTRIKRKDGDVAPLDPKKLVFTEEKFVTVERTCQGSAQNNRVWASKKLRKKEAAKSSKFAPLMIQPKQKSSHGVMLGLALGGDGMLSRGIVMPQGLKINYLLYQGVFRMITILSSCGSILRIALESN